MCVADDQASALAGSSRWDPAARLVSQVLAAEPFV